MSIIATDFDGTLCKNRFPEIGEITEENQIIIDYLRKASSDGDTIILWTCRVDQPERKYLTEAVEFCIKNRIPIHYINENPFAQYIGNEPRKLFADIYIDDKAINALNFIRDLKYIKPE